VRSEKEKKDAFLPLDREDRSLDADEKMGEVRSGP